MTSRTVAPSLTSTTAFRFWASGGRYFASVAYSATSIFMARRTSYSPVSGGGRMPLWRGGHQCRATDAAGIPVVTQHAPPRKGPGAKLFRCHREGLPGLDEVVQDSRLRIHGRADQNRADQFAVLENQLAIDPLGFV